MLNALVWADIPVLDINRAMKFYEVILGIKLKETFKGVAVIDLNQDADNKDCDSSIKACLYETKMAQQMNKLKHEPSNAGVLVYFYVKNAKEVAKLVNNNGGKLLLEEDIPWGRRAIIIDTEGNRVCLFTPVTPAENNVST